MSLDHFTHEHTLILKEDLDSNEKIVCYGCQSPIILGSEALYTCGSSTESCEFYVHKKCADLPKEIHHPMHEPHPLILQPRPPYYRPWCSCNVCKRGWEWFTYNCFTCKFDICLTCAVEDRVFRHAGHHQHTFTLMQREALFKCDACGTEAKDSSYACNSCQFWMHKSCALAPISVEDDFHHHPLVLTYSLPYIHRSFQQRCGLCKKRVHESYWLYYCHKCTYFLHIKCVESFKISTSGENDTTEAELNTDVDEVNLVQFPVLCKESFIGLIIDLFTQANINANLKKVGASTPDHPQTLNHWSHKDHPLILLEEVDTNNEMLICNGCIQPISSAHPIFYGCHQCNFYLHKFCSELPSKLPAGALSRHSEHPLLLYRKREKYRSVKCASCGFYTNGFYFCCDKCNIQFDIRCCFLPNKIKHESHNHPLLNSPPSNSLCSTCGGAYTDTELFKCESSSCSGFQIHKRCALLPSTMRHRWDPHLIYLTYPPFFHEGQIYCEICEEEMNPNYWLYHCRQCDQSFHTYCLCPFNNVKFGDKLVAVGLHRHSLTFVRRRQIDYGRPLSCCNCGKGNLDKTSFIFECASCDILFCVSCVSRNL